MNEEQYVANIVEFTGGINVKVNEDGIKPEKGTKKSILKFGYVLGATIGTGTYSKVKLCYSKKINGNVAVKMVPKKTLSEDYTNKFLPREIALLQKLEHPGLVHMIEVFETMHTMYLVMEYMPKGDLLDYVNSVGSLHEADARRLFRQLIDVVSYLHQNKVYHRDIKLDNILIDAQYNIKLSDFGFARFNPRNEQLQTFCGSYPYAPPEVLDGENYNGAEADVWSTGVCLYGMINGKLPFKDTDCDVLRESMNGHLKFYKRFSRDGRILIRSILEPNTKRRYTLKDIIHSNWMCRPIQIPDGFSMSSLAIAAVSNEPAKVQLYPDVEHGFSCAQNSTDPHFNIVSGVLRSVAANHSSGKSSINLNKVKMPEKKASLPAFVTGVSGPVGRKICLELGIKPEIESANDKSPSPISVADVKKVEKTPIKPKWATAMNDEKTSSGKGKANFRKAIKALNKFKMAVRVVTATKRFRRGPLNTILRISQEKAMEEMIERRKKEQSRTLKHLHYTECGKVATMSAMDSRAKIELVRTNSRKLEEAEKSKNEDIEKIENAFNFMTPISQEQNI